MILTRTTTDQQIEMASRAELEEFAAQYQHVIDITQKDARRANLVELITWAKEVRNYLQTSSAKKTEFTQQEMTTTALSSRAAKYLHKAINNHPGKWLSIALQNLAAEMPIE